jgi:hypothetical protein
LKEEQETYLVYAGRTNSAIKQLYSFMVWPIQTILRPCLDAFKIQKFYFSSHHIESLNTCMEH